MNKIRKIKWMSFQMVLYFVLSVFKFCKLFKTCKLCKFKTAQTVHQLGEEEDSCFN